MAVKLRGYIRTIGNQYEHAVSELRSCSKTGKKAFCSQLLPVWSEQITQIFLAFLSVWQSRMTVLINED